MSKIVRTFVYDSLLKTVSEAGFLDSVKGRLGMKSKSATEPQPNQNAQPAQQASPSIAQAHPEVAAETPLENVISEMIDVPIGESRVVLHLNHEELSKIYLQPDPAMRATLASHLVTESKYSILSSILEADDDNGVIKPALAKVKAQAAGKTPPAPDAKTNDKTRDTKNDPPPADDAEKDPEQKADKAKLTISSLEPGFKFSDIYKDAGNAHYSALLNIPDVLKKEYLAAQDKKPVVEKMLDPRYYIMTINNGEARKIGNAVDNAKDLNDKIAAIDPNIIVNYPKKQTIKQAKDLWNSKYRGKQNDNSADAVAARARKKKPQDAQADETPASGTDQTTTDETPATGVQASDKTQAVSTSSGTDDASKKLNDLKRIYGEFIKLTKEKNANREPLQKILGQMAPYLK